MTQFITHKWLAALGLASSIAAFPALAAKDVVVAVGSNFHHARFRMTPTIRSRRRWRSHFIRGCLAWIKT
ncbi:ABC transporter periplasmic binding protein [Salmonella enterica subsp. enterica]|uniref:ABC transporter periplasmic binding protein n=1 Tax=Salmonella enterica I TaxID=59201 RepID=A0A3S5DN30_SALET|nr:ABC transporter periplasmic binding protein [Salmonella enterica subsp. enterica]